MKSLNSRRIKSSIKHNIYKINLFKYGTISVLIFLIIFSLYTYSNTFKPQLRKLASDKVYYICNLAINEGVSDVLYKNQITYDELVTFLKNENGEITGIMTNLIAVNRLKTEFTVNINNKIQNIEKAEIFIPTGNLTGIEFLSGTGPRIQIYIIPTATTLIDFKNSFEEAGINQTRHEIYLEVKTEMSVLLPDSESISTEVVSKIPLVESIIVGKVPDTLTRVETVDENVREDIMNLN
jgi:sporulation protein YunB